MSLLDHPLIAERYFFPRPDSPRESVQVRVDGATLECAWLRPHPGAPTVLHFHGNGEVVADYLPDGAAMFTRLGLNVFFSEYRGYGGSTGSPQLGAMLDDVPRILDTLDVPDEQLIVFGRSVGSIFAIEAAARRPGLAGLIIESGIASPLERLEIRVTPEELGTTEAELHQEVEARLDHERKLACYSNPLLLLHTRHDGIVDVDHATRNHAWAATADHHKRLVVFERGDHNSIQFMNAGAYWGEVRRFVEGVVAGGSGTPTAEP